MRALDKCEGDLEAPFTFPRETIYFEVIKSQVGISWWCLQSSVQGRKLQDAPQGLSDPFGVFSLVLRTN